MMATKILAARWAPLLMGHMHSVPPRRRPLPFVTDGNPLPYANALAPQSVDKRRVDPSHGTRFSYAATPNSSAW